MKKLHIVHLSTYPVDDIRIFQKACKSELAEGYRVTQITFHDRDVEMEGVQVLGMRKPSGRFSRIFVLSWRMYREALRLNGDIYQIHHPDLIVAGILLKYAGKRVIYEPRECFRDKILSMRWIPKLLRSIVRVAFSAYERITAAFWDHIIVADRHSASVFSGLPVSVVPNYPLLKDYGTATVARRAKRKLLYVGGLADERGLSVMLTIAELLKDSDVQLELMGWFSFPEDESRLTLAKNVRYLGNHDISTVYERMVDADLGLLLLQPVPAYAYAGENTLKLFEYMWCGLPVVSSAFPNLRRIIESAECGVCVHPCDALQAAGTISRLLDDVELRRRMSANGRDAVLRAYNWPAACSVMMQAYGNVLSGTRRAVDPLPYWRAPTSRSDRPLDRIAPNLQFERTPSR